MKRLIKTRTSVEPFQLYQIDDDFVAEENDVEVYRSKHQHLVYQRVKVILAQRRNLRNEQIYNSIQELKAQGIL
jgi:FAD synthase